MKRISAKKLIRTTAILASIIFGTMIFPACTNETNPGSTGTQTQGENGGTE